MQDRLLTTNWLWISRTSYSLRILYCQTASQPEQLLNIIVSLTLPQDCYVHKDISAWWHHLAQWLCCCRIWWRPQARNFIHCNSKMRSSGSLCSILNCRASWNLCMTQGAWSSFFENMSSAASLLHLTIVPAWCAVGNRFASPCFCRPCSTLTPSHKGAQTMTSNLHQADFIVLFEKLHPKTGFPVQGSG